MRSSNKVLGVHMIVKNEAARLPALLDAIMPVVDEVVICDTGSTDGTQAIAARYGARLVHRAWDDNFGAARQHALDHVTAKWAMWLDADDVIDPYDLACLRVALRSLAPHAVMLNVVIKNPPPEPDANCWQLRVFPRLPGVHWEGAVHEQTMPSLERLRIPCMNIGCTVTHTGYMTHRQNHAKFERNLRILKTMEGTERDNIFLWYHLGQTYINLGDLATAETYLLRVANTESRYPTMRNMASRAAALVAQSMVKTTQHEVVRLLQWALDRWPKDDATRVMLAEHLVGIGNNVAAMTVLEPIIVRGVEETLLPYPTKAVEMRAHELFARVTRAA